MNSLAYICVEDPEIKKKVGRMGDRVTFEELNQLGSDPFQNSLGYIPFQICAEGSRLDLMLRGNPEFRGHKYSVKKILSE